MAQTFKHGGRTYSSDRAYRDRDGVTWVFPEQSTDGTAVMVPAHSSGGILDESPLSWVADFCGPLTPAK